MRMLVPAEYGPCMKIATFNINNVRKRLPNLLRWLRAAKPDVVCLQELKTMDPEFPAAGASTSWQTASEH
jgi:exonuclease III